MKQKKKTQEQKREKKQFLKAKKGRFDLFEAALKELFRREQNLRIVVAKQQAAIEAIVKKYPVSLAEINQKLLENYKI